MCYLLSYYDGGGGGGRATPIIPVVAISMYLLCDPKGGLPTIPKVLNSEGPQFRRFSNPKGLKSEGSQVRKSIQ